MRGPGSRARLAARPTVFRSSRSSRVLHPRAGGRERCVPSGITIRGRLRRFCKLVNCPRRSRARAEVRVRVTRSGVNPGDTKKRRGWLGSSMPFPRVIPHSDGAGVVESVGRDVYTAWVGRRAWVYGAQSYRPFGTAAQLTVVPEEQAVDLPDEVSEDLGACRGIPGITAHRAVFGDGPVRGQTVLVQGVLGGSGRWPRSSARWGGAAVNQHRAPPRRPGPGPGLGLQGGSPWMSRTGLGRSGRWLPAESTGSSRSPSPTTWTSTPPWAANQAR